MSFAESAVANSIQLADNHYLVGTLLDSEGNEHSASIKLNQFIGNIDGEFLWGKVNYSLSTNNIWLDTQHAPALILLRGELQKEDESYEPHEINLNEYIQNVEGQFQYIGPSPEE